ncbi:MAG: endonuclease I, partial [bacterium]|nr:endonuclease I [bacterium]
MIRQSATVAAVGRCLVLLVTVVSAAIAQPPNGYYASVDFTNVATMRATLHEVIDDHTRYPYTSTATDTWDILDLADEDPGNPANILDVYRNASYPKAGGDNPNYNREHTWSTSFGHPDDEVGNYPYTDCHGLFLSDSGYYSSRSNLPYRYCSAGCTEKPTMGGTTGSYPGTSNWCTGSGATGTWETWIDRRGDVARALFYMDVRYEGGVHGVTGYAEPDFILTDDDSLIAASNTSNNEPIAYMGILTDLLAWHLEDPVDAVEEARNEVVYLYQGNRNPFIDHPEWVACIFLDL